MAKSNHGDAPAAGSAPSKPAQLTQAAAKSNDFAPTYSIGGDPETDDFASGIEAPPEVPKE